MSLGYVLQYYAMIIFSSKHRKDSIKRARQEVGWAYDDIKWLSPNEADRANDIIRSLILKLTKKATVSFCQSKLHIGSLSPGCEICGEGMWHCIYFNNVCPARCFFCPQYLYPQDDPPQAHGILFDKPLDYVAFLETFGFKGVGFSGGDPLARFDHLISYIKAIKKCFGNSIYVWAYTSGLLVDESKLKQLQKAGLDELRINIIASHYNLKPVSLAKGIIDTVSIEIPSIPEDRDRLIKLFPKLSKIGINYLNLHELAITECNYRKFIKRGYTFIRRGGRISAFESEHSALQILEHALENNVSIPINYCTRDYKHKLQVSGRRRITAQLSVEDYEELTNAGFIRSIYVHDLHDRLEKLVLQLRNQAIKTLQWHWDKTANKLFISPACVDVLKINKARRCLFMDYIETRTMQHVVPNGYEIDIRKGRTIYFSKEPRDTIGPLNMKHLRYIIAAFIDRSDTNYTGRTREVDRLDVHEKKALRDCCLPYERIEEGFPEVF